MSGASSSGGVMVTPYCDLSVNFPPFPSQSAMVKRIATIIMNIANALLPFWFAYLDSGMCDCMECMLEYASRWAIFEHTFIFL